jgi:hypothetical protein
MSASIFKAFYAKYYLRIWNIIPLRMKREHKFSPKRKLVSGTLFLEF